MNLSWKYLLWAFALTWVVWIPGTHLHAGEMIPTFGAAGPALAAMWVARARDKASPQGRRRMGTFAVAALAALTVLEILPPGVPALQWPVRWDPWAIVLAILVGWIASAAWSSDGGIRALMGRLLIPTSWQWTAVAMLAIPAYLLLPAAIARVAGWPVVAPPHPNGYAALVWLAVFLFARNLLLTAVLEEPGWRGTLLRHLQEKRSPLTASLLVWLPWMLWHLPLDLTGGAAHTLAGWLQIRVIFLIPMTILLTWIYNHSGGSLFCAAVFHAVLNTFPFVLPRSRPMLGLVFVWAIWVVIQDRMWRREYAAAESTQLRRYV